MAVPIEADALALFVNYSPKFRLGAPSGVAWRRRRHKAPRAAAIAVV